jgi:hypothetical protein
MRAKIAKFLVVPVCLLTWGCGSAVETNSNTNVVVTNANPANGSDVDVIQPAPVNGVTANSGTGNTNRLNINAGNPSMANAKPMVFPAPDDSEYSTTMDQSGSAIETRTFRKDPVIAKVERIWKGVNDKTVSIYLKNGKVVSVPADKWTDIKSQPVQVFYEAAGVKPPTPPAGTTRKDEKPKP